MNCVTIIKRKMNLFKMVSLKQEKRNLLETDSQLLALNLMDKYSIKL